MNKLYKLCGCTDLTYVKWIQELHKAMKGLGTNDTTLIRIIVTRTEIDMQYIKAEYQKKYKKSLNDAVHSETSGDYRTFLLSLLGPGHWMKSLRHATGVISVVLVLKLVCKQFLLHANYCLLICWVVDLEQCLSMISWIPFLV